MSPDANLHLVWIASFERVAGDFNRARKIFRVNDAARRPVPYLLQLFAKICQKLPIREFDFASRRHPNDETGDTVHNQAQIALVYPHSLFSLFAILNIGKEPIPPGYLTFSSSDCAAPSLNPSVNTINASITMLNLEILAGFD
jgi:hypothetical protein